MKPDILFFALYVSLATVCGGCDPFADRGLKGEFNAGSADPVNYPPPYRGAGATRSIAGSGNGITQVRAWIQGNATGYFLFPFAPSQIVTPGYVYTAAAVSLATQRDIALRVHPTTRLAMPLAYVFDPPGADNPFPPQPRCGAPALYTYDRRRDDVRYDDQGNIFTALPNATFSAGSLPTWSYVPIIREVPVTSNGEPCQYVKSERTLLGRSDVNVPRATPDAAAGAPDNRYLAWALIDPGSGVYRVGQTPPARPTLALTGTDIQHWGWFQQFLVAYIDGGYIPLDSTGNFFRTQNLYIPSQVANGPGKVGAGYDVLQYPRGDPNYSPICQVLVYNTAPGTTLDQLPRSAADVPAVTSPPEPPRPNTIASGDVNPPFVFCLQLP